MIKNTIVTLALASSATFLFPWHVVIDPIGYCGGVVNTEAVLRHRGDPYSQFCHIVKMHIEQGNIHFMR